MAFLGLSLHFKEVNSSTIRLNKSLIISLVYQQTEIKNQFMASISTASSGFTAEGKNKGYGSALALLTSLFFMWGFITVLNDILIPHLKGLFDLNYTQTMLVQFTFFGAYFVMSVPSGWLVSRIGYKYGIVTGLLITGVGALLFLPAAAIVSYGLFLFAFFILASGITILQVAANPFVAILGRPETASSRLNLTQAFNSLGTTIAPIFGSMLILDHNFSDQASEAAAVRLPYILIAATLFIIALVFVVVKLPVIKGESSSSGSSSIWHYRHLVLGAIGIFVYVGSEVSIGSFLVNFFSLKNIAGLSEADAGRYVSFYWGGAMIGRFIGAVIQNYIKPTKVLAVASLFAGLLVLLTMVLSGHFAMWTIISVGLFNSIMFPTIFTLAIDGLGENTSKGSGLLCMAIVGGAIMPLLMGAASDTVGIQLAFFIPFLGYIYVLYYALQGYKHKSSVKL